MRRISVLFALFAVCVPCAYAQLITARCEPAKPVVGHPCAIILEIDVPKDVAVHDVQVGVMPERSDIQLGLWENLQDNPGASHVAKRMRLPIRFLSPIPYDLSLEVTGLWEKTVQAPNYFSKQTKTFDHRIPLHIEVRPPADGCPTNFTGAVGTCFSIRQSLNRDHVRPNDLIKVTYTLEFDVYCPTNVFPGIERLSKDFTAYPLKEVERREGLATNRVTWTQELVPRTVLATNTAFASFNYYNPHTKRYETAHADPLPLVFVSTEAASTENTSVAVTEPAEVSASSGDADAETATQPLVLRFAPSDGSPVIATLPPGTPVKELATWNGWRRLETPRAIGWSKSR